MKDSTATAELTEAVRALAERLHRSGRSPAAEYYDQVAARLQHATDPVQLREVAQELASSARIVELANLDRSSERAFDAMYARAKALLA